MTNKTQAFRRMEQETAPECLPQTPGGSIPVQLIAWGALSGWKGRDDVCCRFL